MPLPRFSHICPITLTDRIQRYRIVPTHVFAIALLMSLLPSSWAVAQTTQPGEATTVEPSVAALALAEGVYTQEFLGDDPRAIELFRRARSAGDLTAIENSQLRLRMAEAFRRLDQPEAARRMLFELLRDAKLRPELREIGDRMLRALRSPSPARLMPGDTMVYVETADLVSLLTRTVELLRLSGATKPPPLTNDLVDRLRHVEALGVGWHGFRADRPATSADVVMLAFTDGAPEAAEALRDLATLLIGASRLDRIERAPPSNAYRSASPGRFWYAADDDLFVLCTDAYAGARAIGLHRGELFGIDTAAASATYGMSVEPGAHLSLYVDWTAISGQSASESPREPELWNELGTTVGMLRLDGTTLNLDANTTILPTRRGLYPVFRSDAYWGAWSNWGGSNVRFELRTSFSRGAERWRHFVRRVFSTNGRDPAWLTQLEAARGIDVGQAIFERIVEVGLFRLGGESERADRAMEWVVALRVDDMPVWVEDVAGCLRYLLLGAIEEAALPVGEVDTPMGVVRVLSPTRGLAGIAWLVRGSEVFIAPSPEILVQFMSQKNSGADQAMVAAGESKRILIDVTRMPAAAGAMDSRVADGPPPMTIMTFERENTIRVVVSQPQVESVLPIFLNWLRDSLRSPSTSRE